MRRAQPLIDRRRPATAEQLKRPACKWECRIKGQQPIQPILCDREAGHSGDHWSNVRSWPNPQTEELNLL
jgi:hypothetical protein